jgi:hypothetical protein
MKTQSGTSISAPQRLHLEFFEVELRADGIIWVQRNVKPFDALADIHRAFDALMAVADDWKLKRRILSGQLGTRQATLVGWLYDVRLAPKQRNDSAFEQAILQRRSDFLQRSPVLVVLVRTASGRLQLSRLSHGDRDHVSVCDDFDQAVAWLRERLRQTPEPPTSPPLPSASRPR